MSGLVTRERVEQLRGFGHRKREHQPVWLGGRERCLGCRGGGASIPQREVRDTSEQMRFNQRERGAGRGRDLRNVSKYVQGAGGVSLRHADHCARVVNRNPSDSGSAENPVSVSRASSGIPSRACVAREPSDDRRRESVHAVSCDCDRAPAANASSAA